MNNSLIRSASEHGAPGIAGIYHHYIVNTCITFEEQPLGGEQIAEHGWRRGAGPARACRHAGAAAL